jgi:hypothetical protein
MPFGYRLILSIIFVWPLMLVSGLTLTAILSPIFRLIPLGYSRYKNQYIPWAISFLITFTLGLIFLFYKKHLWASGMLFVSACCLNPLIPFFGNFLVPFLETFRNVQFLFWIASGLYLCNVVVYQYPLLAIIIGIVCLLLFMLYITMRSIIVKRLMTSLESSDKKDELKK